MTLLSIVQSVCDEIGLPRPAAVVNSNDQLARQMFSLANKELRELSKRFNWPALVRDYTVPVVVNTSAYAMPADYRNMVSSTAYVQGQYNVARGSLTPEEWQRRKQQLLNGLDRIAYRIYGTPTRMYFDPTPSPSAPLVYEYVTKFYAVDVTGVAIPQYAADTDTSAVDEDLVQLGLMWRIKHAKGLEFSADRLEYDMAVPREYAKALGLPTVQVGSRMTFGTMTDGYVPNDNFGRQ